MLQNKFLINSIHLFTKLIVYYTVQKIKVYLFAKVNILVGFW